MGKFIQEFKDFAVKGNMVDMAVGIIIGGAFGKIVSSLVADVFMPILSVFIGGINFTGWKLTLKDAVVDAATGAVTTDAITLNYGMFIQVLFDFLIIAFSIFLVIRLLNRLKKKEAPAPAAEPTPTKEEQLLTEIRDLLKEKK